MITEFTCGAYVAVKATDSEWIIKQETVHIGYINEQGELMYFVHNISYWPEQMLRSIADLMNNIKRQYKQLQTIS